MIPQPTADETLSTAQSGQPGSAGGVYGRKRILQYQIARDQQLLDNAPLGPIQKKRLTKSIEIQKAELAQLNEKIKARKTPTKDQLRIEQARAEGLLPPAK